MIGIYDYKTKDGVFTGFIGTIIFSMAFSMIDVIGAVSVDSPYLYWFGFAFRLIVIIVYSIISAKAYLYYRYLGVVFFLISLPATVWSVIMFVNTMVIWMFIITMILYVGMAWAFVSSSFNKKFDFTKAAKKLLKNYPEPIIVKHNNLLAESERTNLDNDVGSKILSSIFLVIPPWVVFVIPPIFANVVSSFMGLNGLAIVAASSGLFLCIMLSGYFSFHWRYKEVFERAEELLAEKNLTSKE